MTSFKVLTAVVCTVALSACAAPATKVASADGYTCTSEKIIGSNLPQRICTTRAQRDALAEDTRTKMGNLHSRGLSSGAGK